jgi:hypothetical protein
VFLGANTTNKKKIIRVLGLRTAPVVAQDVHGIYAPWDSTPVSEDEAQIKENPEKEITMIHSSEIHPLLNGIQPIYKHLGKSDTNYEIRRSGVDMSNS